MVTGYGLTGAAGVSIRSYRSKSCAEAVKHLLAGLLGLGDVERTKLQARLDVALQVLPELRKQTHPLELLPDHPGAAPGLVGITTLRHVECNRFDGCSAFPQALRRFAADRIDFRIDPDAGDVGGVGDPQTLQVLRCLNRVEQRFSTAAPPKSATGG